MGIPRSTAILLLLTLPAVSRAGLYYSGEPMAELPSQWPGFLLDQRTLRSVAIPPAAGKSAGPARKRYQADADRLEKLAKSRALTADESADLGALYVRLGDAGRALAVLRDAYRVHPNHFHVVANLGTAWQMQGDPRQAALYLKQAIRLAPGKWQRFEEYQLKLVTLRLREPGGSRGLDDLFGVRYVGEGGKYEPGKLAAAERKRLPSYAVAVTQQLALWLPADPRLLWQLAELAGVYGDVRVAAAMMDGCVSQFGLQEPNLREHRRLMRAAADRLAAAPPGTSHGQHPGGLPARSRRPLLTRLDESALPPISATGVNAIPWQLLGETVLDRKHRPTFTKYLRELDGKQVTLTGYIQPLREELDLGAFLLIEYPVGCWYCEMPPLSSIVYIELPKGQTITFTRGPVRITGRLSLNASDPEEFLYTIRQAKAADVN
jgi:hypothetical protein